MYCQALAKSSLKIATAALVIPQPGAGQCPEKAGQTVAGQVVADQQC
ncbi:hypothetical protein ACXO6B_04130 [Lactobacillus delbrueckii subsp. bulgaricus]